MKCHLPSVVKRDVMKSVMNLHHLGVAHVSVFTVENTVTIGKESDVKWEL